MARPSVTDPPGELMYTEMSRSLCSASRRMSCEQTRLAVFWSMAEPMKTMRSLSRRWKMSLPGPTSFAFISARSGVANRAEGTAGREESRGAMRAEPTAWYPRTDARWALDRPSRDGGRGRSGGGPHPLAQLFDQVIEPVGGTGESELLNAAPAGRHQPIATDGVVQQAGDCLGHTARAPS